MMDHADDGKKIYWLLPTNNKFKKSLEELSRTEPYLTNFIKLIGNRVQKYVFISLNNNRWGYNPKDENSIKNEWYEKHNFKFKGLVNIEPYEFSQNKYNL